MMKGDALFIFVLLLTVISQTDAISQSARRVQTTFTFQISSQPATNTTSECPETINHASIRTYRGINPKNRTQILDGIRWRDLIINRTPCLDSTSVNAATFFTTIIPSPPETSADIATPWFLIATDNSPRRCGQFSPQNPARYFFTDDMPRFKQRFLDEGLLPRNVILPAPLQNPIRGDIYMISQQFQATDPSTVASNIVCFFRSPLPSAAPTPTPIPDDSGSVCFPASAKVTRKDGIQLHMHTVSVGDLVQVSSTQFSPIIAFSHREPHRRILFLRISLRVPSQLTNHSLVAEMTPSHLLRKPDGSLTPADDLLLGDNVSVVHTGRIATVVALNRVWRDGVYSPVTQHGDLVVDGVVASCYTTSVRVSAAHALLAPVRASFRLGVSVDWCRVVDVLRWAFR